MLHWTLYHHRNKFVHNAVVVGHKVYYLRGAYKLHHTTSPFFRNVIDQMRVNIFDTVFLRWMKVPKVAMVAGQTPPEVPPLRHGQTAVLIDHIIYLWGGVKFGSEHCNVLYAFDVNTHSWSTPKISGAIPKGRDGHSAWLLGKVMYIFGGCTDRNTKPVAIDNSMYKLDTITMVWAFVNTRGSPAPAGYWYSATIIKTKLYVFGGQGGQDHDQYNDVKVFDTETNFWLSTPSAQLPEARASHSAFAYNGELFIIGGHTLHTQGHYINDIWKFNTETFSWKKVEPKGKGPSWMYEMCCCMVGDRIILGCYETTDLYILDLCPSLNALCKLAVLKYGLTHSELPRNIRWELAAIARKRKITPV